VKRWGSPMASGRSRLRVAVRALLKKRQMRGFAGGKRQEQTQMITRAIGRLTHTALPTMITISRSRP
jgi:hypothetical protein